MRKSMLIAMAAAAMLAGCNRAEIVEQNPETAISFGTSFVNNMTKVTENDDFSNTNKPTSSVYGVMKVDGGDFITAFNKVTVNETGEYNPKQYWQKGANYWFEAFAPADHAAWAFEMSNYSEIDNTRGTLSFNNETAQGQVDLLAAVPSAILNVKPGTQEKVALDFEHQLSRVKVKFINKDLSSAYNFVFQDVKISNAVKTATMDINKELATEPWAAPVKGTGKYILNMPEPNTRTNSGTALNNVISEHVYLIPDAEVFTVSFTVVMYQNDEAGEHFVKEYKHVIPNVKIPNMTKGNSYILTAELTEKNIVPVDPDDPDKPVDPDDQLHYIEFTVDVEAWEDWNTENAITVPDTPVQVKP